MDTVLKDFYNDILEAMKQRLSYDDYMMIFDHASSVFDNPQTPTNPSFEFMGQTLELPIFNVYMTYRNQIFVFIRGFFYPLIVFYLIDNIYVLIRGQRILKDGPHVSKDDSKGGKR